MKNISPPVTSYCNNLSVLPQLDGNVSISSSVDEHNLSNDWELIGDVIDCDNIN